MAITAAWTSTTHAWASPWMRSIGVAVFVALSVGSTPRFNRAPVAPAVVDVRANTADTEIFLDGAPRGRAPVLLRLAPGPHVVTAKRQGETRTTALTVTAGARILEFVEWPPPRPARPEGSLRVASSPAGARVTIDGRVRGVTPLTVGHLAPGRHKVFLESAAGSVRAVGTVANGETANLDVPIFAGWIAVFAPVELQIEERGRPLGTSESGRIMIAPGRHVLRLVNSELGYESIRVVEVLPGEIAAVSITTVP